MKKVLSILLIIVCAFSLISCDSKETDNNQQMTQSEIFLQQLVALENQEPEYVSETNSSLLAPAQNSEKLWGYINLQGEWVVNPEYMTATCFSEGYAMVLDQYYEYSLIDKTGNVVLSHFDRHSISEASYFKEGLLPVTMELSSSQKIAYINTELVKPFTAWNLPEARTYSDYRYFGFASNFSNGLALVMRLKNSDISDKKGPEKASIITSTGAIVGYLPEGLDPDQYGFDEQGNVVVRNTDTLYGLCDNEGNLVLECKYKRILHCDGPLYLTCNDNGFWGYITENGEVVIDFVYQKAYPFSDGLAAVFDGTSWGFINEKGETVIDFMFDDVYALNNSCYDSSVNKAVFNNGIAAVLKSNHWVLINKNAKPIFALNMATYEDYSDCPFISMEGNYISYVVEYSKGDNVGVVNTEGQIVIKNGFLSIGHFK